MALSRPGCCALVEERVGEQMTGQEMLGLDEVAVRDCIQEAGSQSRHLYQAISDQSEHRF